MTATERALGRGCNGCTLCCTLMRIDALSKPARQWCSHCNSTGCGIYERRPAECRTFVCSYLQIEELGEHWYPKVSGMVVSHEDGGHVFVFVDASRPRWQEAPYYADLKSWASQLVPKGIQVRVELPARTIMILPDRDVDLGLVGEDESVIIATAANRGQALQWFVVKKRRGEPDKGPEHWL